MPSKEFDRIDLDHREIVESHLAEKPVRLGCLAKELGISVKLSALERGRSGLIEVEDSAYTIKINRHETRERQRFTLAHEIAHFLIHRAIIDTDRKIVDNVLYRSGQSKAVEYEANRLAADLIMPDNQIEVDIETLDVPITEDVIARFADEWQVSKAAMEIRLSNYAA